jgi:uncharacterized RmlC-like cupin family protein
VRGGRDEQDIVEGEAFVGELRVAGDLVELAPELQIDADVGPAVQVDRVTPAPDGPPRDGVGYARSMSAGCEIVRLGEPHEGAQRLLYAPGVTGATTPTRGLCLTSAELPAGVRSACHLHRGIESAGYVVSGTIDVWWGERLESHALLGAGEFAYIPPELPHVVGNAGSEPALIVVAHSSASDQDGIEVLPELDLLLGGR